MSTRVRFIIYDIASGTVLARLYAVPSDQQMLPGQALLVMADEAIDLIGDPSEEAQAIVLSGVRAALWEKVKLLRSAAVDSPFTVEGIGTFDCTAQSRENIHGAVTGALLASLAAQPFSIEWTLADNSVATLDGTQVLAVGQAMLAHVNGCYEVARGLRAGIEEPALALADLLQIDVTAGWGED